jgi:MFS family permease
MERNSTWIWPAFGSVGTQIIDYARDGIARGGHSELCYTRFPGGYFLAAALTGLGTATVYPTLLALVSDVAEPAWRASSLGVYRFWRDLGYAVGALGAGLLADALNIPAAMVVVAVLALLSAVIVAIRAKETKIL